MSRRSDGSYKCDRCGVDVDNGRIQLCVPASDIDGNGNPVQYHFCRVNKCAGKVLSKRNLDDYLKAADHARR